MYRTSMLIQAQGRVGRNPLKRHGIGPKYVGGEVELPSFRMASSYLLPI